MIRRPDKTALLPTSREAIIEFGCLFAGYPAHADGSEQSNWTAIEPDRL